MAPTRGRKRKEKLLWVYFSNKKETVSLIGTSSVFNFC